MVSDSSFRPVPSTRRLLAWPLCSRDRSLGFTACLAVWALWLLVGSGPGRCQAGDDPPAKSRPADTDAVAGLLEQYCFGCHGLGAKKGGVALDAYAEARNAPKVWHAVLKNLRSQIMPPADKPQPTAEERTLLENWIKREAFAIDPGDPDPGRVTVRRLNRVE